MNSGIWGRMIRQQSLLLLLCLVLCLPTVCKGQPNENGVVVAITDYLAYSDVAHLRPGTWRGSPSFGLMSVGLASGRDPAANVFASLGAGDSIHAGDMSTGRLCAALSGVNRQVTLIGNVDGAGIVRYRPVVDFAPKAKYNLVGDPEYTIKDATAPGGIRTDVDRLWYVENYVSDDQVVIVHLGDMARLERARRDGRLSPNEYRRDRRLALSRISDAIEELEQSLGNNEDPAWL